MNRQFCVSIGKLRHLCLLIAIYCLLWVGGLKWCAGRIRSDPSSSRLGRLSLQTNQSVPNFALFGGAFSKCPLSSKNVISYQCFLQPKGWVVSLVMLRGLQKNAHVYQCFFGKRVVGAGCLCKMPSKAAHVDPDAKLRSIGTLGYVGVGFQKTY